MAKRKTRMGSAEVAAAYTERRKEEKAVLQKAKEDAGKGGFPKRKPTYANQEGLDTLHVIESCRWPSEEQLDKYAELNQDKKSRRPGKPKKVRPVEFPLMDEIDDVTRNRMLIAASLKLQTVKSMPGFVFTRTYNHKNRPITFV